MRNKQARGLRSPFGALSALVLAVLGLFLVVFSFRVAAVHQLSPDSPSAPGFVRRDPELVLREAAADLVRLQGILSPATLAAVRTAALRAPLDANAFLVLGHQDLLNRDPERAQRTLEAGRRLDPRNRVIHLLLLDRYLREQRYADAAAEFAVLSRLVGPAQGPIATALAQMSQAPETRDAARRTLQTDPALENSVLVTLAKSAVPPSAVFDLASPAARSMAGNKNSWGPPLIERLVANKQYSEARAVWQRIYGLAPARAGALLYDAGLRNLPGSAPFNWMLTAGSLGAADMRNGTLAVEYYGRDRGDLARQLLVLRPGAYRFRFVVEGKTPAGATLYWSLRCANDAKVEPMRALVKGDGPPRAILASFIIPAGCPAQTLTLMGEAGEFPVAINVTLRDLGLGVAAESRP